jgi:hypothetical protein
MMPLMTIALVGWFPLAILLFAKMPARRALPIAVLGAVMFLPMGELKWIPLVPGRKDIIICLGLGLAAVLMDPAPLANFRPKWIDAPIILLCLNPFPSAMLNGLPFIEAVAFSLATFVDWGLPYLLGRVYLTDVRAAWYMAWCIFIGGLIYAPGCIFEMIMSPTLHQRVYGVAAFPDFLQSVRLGGYRPVMFMQHGLMVGTFMCCAALMGIWLWWNGAIKSVFRFPKATPVVFLTLVAIACKSAGSILLMFVGLGVLFFTRYARKPYLVYALVAAAPIYILARTVGGWTGDSAVDLATKWVDKEHGGSLSVRFGNENVLVDRGRQKMIFGWGPNGDFLIKDLDGRVVSIPDGMWVIAFGGGGLIGLTGLFGAMLAPTIALMRRFPVRTWAHPVMAAPAALAVFLPTYAIDCLMNAMVNPVWMVGLGAISALATVQNPFARPAGTPKRRPMHVAQTIEIALRNVPPQQSRPAGNPNVIIGRATAARRRYPDAPRPAN